jgi:putative transposase
MDVTLCVSAVEEALAGFGKPEIVNTDQGSQFTTLAFNDVLKRAGVRISMDERGRWMDNVFIERLWRSLMHEDIYLKGYTDGREARAGIARIGRSRTGHDGGMARRRAGSLGAQAVDMTQRGGCGRIRQRRFE